MDSDLSSESVVETSDEESIASESELDEDSALSENSTEDESEEDEPAAPAGSKAGMADVISKILTKQVADDSPAILSKRKARRGESEDAKPQKKKKKALDHQAWEELQHVIPDGSRCEVERELHRIATRGVVKLFNAVHKHQKELDSQLDKSGMTQAKRSKVMSEVSKDHFLDMLRDKNGANQAAKAKDKGEDSSTVTLTKKSEKKPTSSASSSWSVLKDDFMMGAKLKDWDRESSSDSGDNADYDDSSGSDDS